MFAGDDDSDEDGARRRAQERGLEALRGDAGKGGGETASGVVPDDEGEKGEKLEKGVEGEEDELKRLRGMRAYGVYAEKFGRDRAAVVRMERGVAAERAAEVERARGEDDGDGGDGEEVGDREEAGYREEAEDIEEDVRAAKFVPVGAGGTRVEEDAERPRKITRPKRALDPKIIDDSSDDDDDGSSDSDSDAPLGPQAPPLDLSELPVSHSAELGSTHSAYVSCMTLDAAGIRLITGSMDCTLRLWDFNVMDRRMLAFRTVQPMAESPVRSVQWSRTGSRLLCCGGLPTARVLSRDGAVLAQTAGGDVYIVDMARTKGHTGAVSAALWRPENGSGGGHFVTAAADATVRLWDVSNPRSVPMVDNPVAHQLRVIKLRNARGSKTIPTAMGCMSDGKLVAVGCDDHSIKLIDPNAFAMRPALENHNAVESGADITCVTPAPSSCSAPLVLVRSTDDKLRVFDTRRFDRPVAEFGGLLSAESEMNAAFIGATGGFFATGTSANRKRGTEPAKITVYGSKTMQPVWSTVLEPSAGSAVTVMWHEKINQVLYGCGDGKVRVLYNPESSKGGVMNCIVKAERHRAHGMVSVGIGTAYTPTEQAAGAGQAKRQKLETAKSKQPQREPAGPDQSKMASAGTFTKYLAKTLVSSEWIDEDPRDALLRHDQETKKNPKFTKVYQQIQPTVLADKTAEQEEEDSRQAIRARDRVKSKR